MALEYTFEAAAEVDSEELFDFFKQVTGAEAVELGDRFLRTPGMDIMPRAVDPDSPRELEDYVPGAGFRTRVRVDFRMRNLAEEEERDWAHALMLRSVLSFFGWYPGDGILLQNSERVILARYGDEIVFDDWEGFDEVPEMAAIVAPYPRRELAQPFL